MLLRELTHPLVKRDFADAPPWLDEGFAALHEVSHWGNRLVGDPIGVATCCASSEEGRCSMSDFWRILRMTW